MNSFERVKLVTKTMEKFSQLESGKYVCDADLFETRERLIDEVGEYVETDQYELEIKLAENTKLIADELRDMKEFFEWAINRESTAAVVADISHTLSVIAEYVETYLSTQGQTPKHHTKQFECPNQRDLYAEPIPY